MPKISQLPPGTVLTGPEMIPDVQSGVTVRTTPSAVAAYVLGQLPDLPVEVKDANFEILNSVDTTKVAKFSAAAISPATTRTFDFPDVSGVLVILDAVQTLENKTLDNTNTIVVHADNFTIQDQTDPTKQAQFVASSISPATIRSYTLPNANATLVGLDTAQTLQNKTIDNTNSATILDTQFTIQDNVDPTKQARVNASGISAATTRTYDFPNANGTLALTSDITQYLPITRQVFTSGGTWTRPTGCRSVRVTVVGGGGGGGGVPNTAARSGSGGGGGGGGISILDVSSIASSTIAIGSGGAGGVSGVSAPGNGGTSSWTDGVNTITATGGTGGANDPLGGATIAGGAAGASTGGNVVNISGGVGGSANVAILAMSARGGGAPFGVGFGGGGQPVASTSVGTAGTGYGSGGGGAINNAGSTAQTGGSGAPGVIVVEEFY